MMSPLLSRRGLLLASGATALGVGAAMALGGRNLFYDVLTETVEGDRIDAPTAHRRARGGDLLLIDIRRPEEWASTGAGEGAHKVDMRRPDFADAVLAIAGGDPARPIAFICARGVRSARVSNDMIAAGFSRIIDVPEGMLGSSAGPGWIARGLPLERG
ncbi:MAG: rhodanese-like domain-containing protein [Pseudomonadota bacterium]